MQIYSGTVTDVTEEILWVWLLRDWLRAWEVRIEPNPELVDVAMRHPVTTAGTGLLIMGGMIGEEVIRVEADRQPLWTRCLFLAPNAADGGILELRQWRAAAVQVTFYELVTDLFADSLRTWLQERYECKVTHQQLSQRQQQTWNELQEFTQQVKESGRDIGEAESSAPWRVEPGTMRKRWKRLRAEIGIDPPWPR